MATTPGTSQALTAVPRTASTCGSIPAAASAGSLVPASAARFRTSAPVAASVAVVFKRSRRVGLARILVALLAIGHYEEDDGAFDGQLFTVCRCSFSTIRG